MLALRGSRTIHQARSRKTKKEISLEFSRCITHFRIAARD